MVGLLDSFRTMATILESQRDFDDETWAAFIIKYDHLVNRWDFEQNGAPPLLEYVDNDWRMAIRWPRRGE